MAQEGPLPLLQGVRGRKCNEISSLDENGGVSPRPSAALVSSPTGTGAHLGGLAALLGPPGCPCAPGKEQLWEHRSHTIPAAPGTHARAPQELSQH